MRREDGDVEGVVLRESLVNIKTHCSLERKQRHTLRPITPIQAIEGIAVAMIALAECVGQVGIELWLEVMCTNQVHPGQI